MVNISDDYGMMKTWLITNYGEPARIVGDIISNISKRAKPTLGNGKEKLSFHAAITGAKQSGGGNFQLFQEDLHN